MVHDQNLNPLCKERKVQQEEPARVKFDAQKFHTILLDDLAHFKK
jgi:hypothetical protein